MPENRTPGAGKGSQGVERAHEQDARHSPSSSCPGKTSRLLTAALGYASELGWAVLPLSGKVPVIPGSRGYLDATTDPGTITRWWQRYPCSNVGLSCIGSGLLAIDIDPRDGGDRTWKEVIRHHPPLPRTPRQMTGGGGWHILFRAPADTWIRGTLGAGVQLKWRGYIVVAPSIHPDTGLPYRWNPERRPVRTPLAELPDWLLGAITLVSIASGAGTGPARPSIEEEQGWGPRPAYTRAALEPARRSRGHHSVNRSSPSSASPSPSAPWSAPA